MLSLLSWELRQAQLFNAFFVHTRLYQAYERPPEGADQARLEA
jgi:hypothetical protein